MADSGGAIRIDCSAPSTCTTVITNSTFRNNAGLTKGGAIHYNLQRPMMDSNNFENNRAPYGPDIASYATKLVKNGTTQNQIYIKGVGSGVLYPEAITIAILDNDNQLMNQESSSSLKILVLNHENLVAGITSQKLTNGIATFSDLTFLAEPGHENVEYRISSKLIDPDQLKYGTNMSDSKLHVSFRYCMPGEIQLSNKCVKCSYNSYSLGWNSSKCENCIDNASCMGGAEIRVDKGYWRRSTNSTETVKCLKEQACAGGYNPDEKYPVECQTGYSGIL